MASPVLPVPIDKDPPVTAPTAETCPPVNTLPPVILAVTETSEPR